MSACCAARSPCPPACSTPFRQSPRDTCGRRTAGDVVVGAGPPTLAARSQPLCRTWRDGAGWSGRWRGLFEKCPSGGRGLVTAEQLNFLYENQGDGGVIQPSAQNRVLLPAVPRADLRSGLSCAGPVRASAEPDPNWRSCRSARIPVRQRAQQPNLVRGFESSLTYFDTFVNC